MLNHENKSSYVDLTDVEIVFLPKQLGTSVLHVPKEVHFVSAVPFRRKPSSHVDEHREPKLNSSCGSEQTKEP